MAVKKINEGKTINRTNLNKKVNEGRKPSSPYSSFKSYSKGFNQRTLKGSSEPVFGDNEKRLGKIENDAYKAEIDEIKNQVGDDSVKLSKLARERRDQHRNDLFNYRSNNKIADWSDDEIRKFQGKELAASHLLWSANDYNRAHGIKTESKKITADPTKDTKVRDWYIREFRDDKLGREIDGSITFEQLWNIVKSGENVYDYLAWDSIIRERCFVMLSEILNVDYDVIFDTWIGKTESLKKPRKYPTLKESKGAYSLYDYFQLTGKACDDCADNTFDYCIYLDMIENPKDSYDNFIVYILKNVKFVKAGHDVTIADFYGFCKRKIRAWDKFTAKNNREGFQTDKIEDLDDKIEIAIITLESLANGQYSDADYKEFLQIFNGGTIKESADNYAYAIEPESGKKLMIVSVGANTATVYEEKDTGDDLEFGETFRIDVGDLFTNYDLYDHSGNLIKSADDNIYEAENRGSKPGVKRGEYKKKPNNDRLADMVYRGLEKMGYTPYAEKDCNGYWISRRNEKNLQPAKDFLDKKQVKYSVKNMYGRNYMTILIPEGLSKEMVKKINEDRESARKILFGGETPRQKDEREQAEAEERRRVARDKLGIPQPPQKSKMTSKDLLNQKTPRQIEDEEEAKRKARRDRARELLGLNNRK